MKKWWNEVGERVMLKQDFNIYKEGEVDLVAKYVHGQGCDGDESSAYLKIRPHDPVPLRYLKFLD